LANERKEEAIFQMSFRCALCPKAQPKGEPALVVFLCPEDKEKLQKRMKPIKKFNKYGKPSLKPNPSGGKGNIDLCQTCHNKYPNLNKRYAQWQSNRDKK